MLAHVIDRIRPQTSGPLFINANDTTGFNVFGLPVVPDGDWAGAGPLSGIHAALQWALGAGCGQIATVAVDQPFLPSSYLATLSQAGAPSIARCGGRLHPINAIWSASQLPALCGYLETGRRNVHGWAELCLAKVAEFSAEPSPIDPFLNINAMPDLEFAAQFLAKT